MLTLLAVPLTLLSMQQPGAIAQRLAGRVSPNVAALVEQLGTTGSARGLPVDPLIQKAIEGSAKGIPEGTNNDGGGGAIHAQGGRLKVVNARFFNNVCDDLGSDVGGGAIRKLDYAILVA